MIGRLTKLFRGEFPSPYRGSRIWATLSAIGSCFDDYLTLAESAMKKRFPMYDSDGADALPRHGDDRQIIRGLSESNADYSDRLKAWLVTHQSRATNHQLVIQTVEYYRHAMGAERLLINLHTKLGNWYTWDSDVDDVGTVRQDAADWTFDDADEAWPRWRLHIRYHAAAIDVDERQALAVPRAWNAAHCTGTVMLQANGAVCWDEPGVVWDDPDVLWGDDDDVVQYETHPRPDTGFDTGFSSGFGG